MKKRRMVALAAAVCMLLSGCGALNGEYKLGLGAQGSDSYSLGAGMTELLAKEAQGIKLSPVETYGTTDSVKQLANGEVEFALLSSDAARSAYAQNNQLRAVTDLAPLCLHLVVTEASGIASIADLKARRVSLGTAQEGTYDLAMEIISAAGLELKDLQRRSMSMGDSVEAMKNGELDAAFFLAVPGCEELTGLWDECSVRLIDITGDAASAVVGGREFETDEIPANTYSNQENAVATVSTDLLLVCLATVPDKAIAEIRTALDTSWNDFLLQKGIKQGSESKNIFSIPGHNGITLAGEK